MDDTSTRTRLAPDERRQQLLEVASRLLSEHGVDALQITELASAAGVTRPVVYRFFDNRQAVIMAVLEDFEAELSRRFFEEGMRSIAVDSLEDVARVFVRVVCDTIEVRGAGPWHLLDSKGPDPEVAGVARTIQDRLIQPWHPRIALVTGLDERTVAMIAKMLVAQGRAALDLWLDGTLSRDEAIDGATRGIKGLLNEFVARVP